MRTFDGVLYRVGSDIRLVTPGHNAFSGIINYQLVGENFLEVLKVSWLYLKSTDYKNQFMDKTIPRLALSVILEKSCNNYPIEQLIFCPETLEEVFRGDFFSKKVFTQLNIKKTLDVI